MIFVYFHLSREIFMIERIHKKSLKFELHRFIQIKLISFVENDLKIIIISKLR